MELFPILWNYIYLCLRFEGLVITIIELDNTHYGNKK